MAAIGAPNGIPNEAITFPDSTTLIGPLTTTFIPPPDCNYVSFQKSSTDVGLAFAYMYDIELQSGARCFPPGALTTKGYFSPGVCPSGWQSQVTTNGLEKTHNCCPSFATTMYTDTSTSTLPLLLCVGLTSQIASSTIAYYTSGTFIGFSRVSQVVATLEPKAYVVIAGGVQVRFKDSDFTPMESTSVVSSTSTTISISSPATSTSDFSNRPPQTDASDSAGKSTGLPSSAKIGVGVGVSLVFLLVAAVAFVCLRQRRKRLNNSTDDVHDSNFPENDKAELPDGNGQNMAFLGGTPLEKSELDNTTKVMPIKEDQGDELENEPAKAELGGSIAHSEIAELAGKSRDLSRLPSDTAELPATTANAPITRKAAPKVTPSKLPDQGNTIEEPSSQSFWKDRGPLPSASELFPVIDNSKEDDDLEYQERRLRERRELIAEKERLQRDEDILRERKAEAKRKGGGGSAA